MPDYLTDIFHKAFFDLLGRFSQYFIAVFADIEIEKIKTVMDICYIRKQFLIGKDRMIVVTEPLAVELE